METISLPRSTIALSFQENYLNDLEQGKFYRASLNGALDCVFEVTSKKNAESVTLNVIAFTHLNASAIGPLAMSSKPVEITLEDFPLLISWDYKSDEFCGLLKGASN